MCVVGYWCVLFVLSGCCSFRGCSEIGAGLLCCGHPVLLFRGVCWECFSLIKKRCCYVSGCCYIAGVIMSEVLLLESVYLRACCYVASRGDDTVIRICISLKRVVVGKHWS